MADNHVNNTNNAAAANTLEENARIINRVSYGSMAVNLLLSAVKLIAGLLGHSAALVSDAVHSASDVFSTIVVLLGIHFSNKEADSRHEYGHERIECLAAILLAGVLAVTGLMIGSSGVQSIFSGSYKTAPQPAVITMIAAAGSILVKEVMYHVTKRAALKVKSSALMADAWHHRSDALSSVGSLVGVFCARRGFPIGDPIAALIICVFILKAAMDIFMDAAGKLMDTSCSDETEEEMISIAKSVEGVCGVDSIRTRQFGNRVYVDMEISAEGTITLYQAHEIAENVHDEIERSYENVKHCMVHVNPK